MPTFDKIIQTPKTTSYEHLRRRHEKEASRGKRAQKRLARTALGATITTGLFTGALQYDIAQGREAVEASTASIEHVYNPHDAEYDNAATIILPGFGTRSAVAIAERLEMHAETGHVFALEYSNADVDIEELTDLVVNALETQTTAAPGEKRFVNFDGYSAGGTFLTAVAANIHTRYPDIVVTGDAMNSTPIGPDGLSGESSESIEMLGAAIEFCDRIKLCAGIEYSRAVHHVVELASRHDAYYDSATHHVDFDALKTSAEQVNQKLSARDAPSLSLAYQQAEALEGASNTLIRNAQENFHVEYGIEQSVAALSKPALGKPAVQLFYTMAESPTADRVVDVQASAHALQEIAEETGADLQVVPLAVSHVNLYQKADEYNAFIAAHVNPTARSVASQQQRLPLRDSLSPLRTPRHPFEGAFGAPSQTQTDPWQATVANRPLPQ